MYNIKDVYIGRIYDIFSLKKDNIINTSYCAFVKDYNDEFKEEYLLINRGQINKKTIMFDHGTVFLKIDDINVFFGDDISPYYVDDLKPLTNFMKIDNIKPYISNLEIHCELIKINTEKRKNIAFRK